MSVSPVVQSTVPAFEAVKAVHAPLKTGHVKKGDLDAAAVSVASVPRDGRTSKVDAAPSLASTSSLEPVPVHEGDGDKVPGVIRLLEAGHFKGVADVRLRINFFDELSDRAGQDGAAVAQQEVANLAETVGAAVGELVGALPADEATEELVSELVGEFDAALLVAVEELPAGEGVDPDALAEAIQLAFGTLLERLTTLLAGESGESGESEPPGDVDAAALLGKGAGGTTAVAASDTVAGESRATDRSDSVTANTVEPSDTAQEPGGDLPSAVDEALASLVAAFDQGLEDLLSAIHEAGQLPDPSPPSGNGGAYDKFLAIYNQLRGGGSYIDERS